MAAVWTCINAIGESQQLIDQILKQPSSFLAAGLFVFSGTGIGPELYL